MASNTKDFGPSTSKADSVSDDLEPGACPESVLNPTDSFEELTSEMSTSLQERNVLTLKNSTISEIQSEMEDQANGQIKTTKSNDDLQNKDVS